MPEIAADITLDPRFLKLVKAGSDSTPDGEWEPLVMEVLRQACFNVGAVKKHRIVRHYRDDQGERPETYIVNAYSGIEVSDIGCRNATGWLDELWRSLDRCKTEDAMDVYREIIAKSRPLRPVVLSQYGEALREYPPGIEMGGHATDATKLNTCVGVHAVCHGWVDIRAVSATHNALVCRQCYLRVVIPESVVTFGDLRRHFADFQPK